MFKKLEKSFKALADRNRMRIINMLTEKEMCVCEITHVLRLSQSTVSGHLRILKEAGLVEDTKDGPWVEYRLKTAESWQGELLSLIRETAEVRPLWKNAFYFTAMVGILVFANWGRPQPGTGGLWSTLFDLKWWLPAAFLLGLALMLTAWFKKDELSGWTASSWGFFRQILPLLLAGVLGSKKTLVFVGLVVVMATMSGLIFGLLF